MNWLDRKTDRRRRLPEIRKYIADHAPELHTADPGVVIDVGPGPGEFLELARDCGHTILGVDAPTGEGGMGNDYLARSRELTEAAGVPVEYCGIWDWLDRGHETIRGNVLLVNFRGSIEQCFNDWMTGPAHHTHHDCHKQNWAIDAQVSHRFVLLFSTLAGMLRANGHILVHANGSGSTDTYYDETVRSAALMSGLSLVKQEGLLLHKWGLRNEKE